MKDQAGQQLAPHSSKQLMLWLGLLTVLTSLGVFALNLSHVNPANGFSPAIILIAYASSLAALCATAITLGRKGVSALLKQICHWRVGVRWYALALLGPLVLLGLAHALYILHGASEPNPWLDFSGLAPGIGAIIAGSFGEEIGWRGFAQPLLQRRYSVFWASIIVGLIWATWHCWPVLAPGGHEHRWVLDIGLTYLRLISTAVIYGWLYQVTRGSLLVVMLAHAGHNIAVDIMPVPDTAYGLMALVAVLYFVSALVLTVAARKRLFAYAR